MNLRIEIDEKFPEIPPKIAVIPDGMMPEKLVESLNSAFLNRLKDEKGSKGIFRAFFGWLDRNLQNLFVDGLKKVKMN